jgi:CO/xanthine dehydrogenase FAD-binding subunit
VNVLMPRSVSEACELLATHEGAIPIAGGTDLFVHWPLKLEDHDRTFMDLSGLEELRCHRWTEDELVLGALTTYWDIIGDPRAGIDLPLLVSAARQVGAIQIQTRGTWAGNIVNASPAADGVAVLMAYDATVKLQSGEGTEDVPLSDFYLGYKVMRRSPTQLLTEIRIPIRSYDFQMFEKVGSRAAQAITKVGVAVTRRGEEWRVVTNSVAPTVCRCPTLESFLATGQPVASPEDLVGPLGEDVSPIDDIRSTARYRETVLARLLYFGLREHCPSFT